MASGSIKPHRYGTSFRLIVTETRLGELARKAEAQALRLDDQEAPRREIARQQKERDDGRAAAAKARVANKGMFRPGGSGLRSRRLFRRGVSGGSAVPHVLAEMVGTTRSLVNFFMNKFRKLGFIEYNGGLKIHHALLSVVLHDAPGSDH
jgi:hypothetical protein